MHNSLAEQLAQAFGIREQGAPTQKSAPRTATVIDSGPAVLAGNVEKVILQFSFVHDFLVPAWVWKADDETREERVSRKTLTLSIPGVQFLPNTEYVYGCDLRERLFDEGFTLVDGHFKERINGAASGKDKYHMVRFTFYRTVTNVTDTYGEVLAQEIGPSLDVMFERSLWRTRGYNNPLVREGSVVEGKRMISLNFEFPEQPGREDIKVLSIRNHKVVIR